MEKIERITDTLSKQEQKDLKAMIKGYGKLEQASKISGVNRKTLERIAMKGRGLERSIKPIRTKLLIQD